MRVDRDGPVTYTEILAHSCIKQQLEEWNKKLQERVDSLKDSHIYQLLRLRKIGFDMNNVENSEVRSTDPQGNDPISAAMLNLLESPIKVNVRRECSLDCVNSDKVSTLTSEFTTCKRQRKILKA